MVPQFYKVGLEPMVHIFEGVEKFTLLHSTVPTDRQ